MTHLTVCAPSANPVLHPFAFRLLYRTKDGAWHLGPPLEGEDDYADRLLKEVLKSAQIAAAEVLRGPDLTAMLELHEARACRHGLLPDECAECSRPAKKIGLLADRLRRYPVANVRPATLSDVVMQAAKTLSQPFTKPLLVIAAWKLDPARCGLEGHECFPDSAKVMTAVYGAKGLIAAGKLLAVEGGFCLPEASDDSAA